MTNIERVRISMRKYKYGTIFSRGEITDIVRAEFSNDKFSLRSIMPSDYCYNLMNMDKLNNTQLLNFNIFEYHDKDRYTYLGEQYPYNKEIYHKPKLGSPYIIGKWVNGERILGSPNVSSVKNQVNTQELSSTSNIVHKTTREAGLKLRFMVMKRDNFKCCICGSSPAKNDFVELHIDHIIPWSKGGETVMNNLQTLCSKCNIGKGNL